MSALTLRILGRRRGSNGDIRPRRRRAFTTLRAFNFDERKRHAQKAGAVVIEEPQPDTPAATAGLRRGDVIVSFKGLVVEEPGDLYSALQRSLIGVECPLEYLRDDVRHATTIVPKERPRPTTTDGRN